MSELLILEEVEDFPDYRCVTVKHLDEQNTVVRQDIRIEMKKPLDLTGASAEGA